MEKTSYHSVVFHATFFHNIISVVYTVTLLFLLEGNIKIRKLVKKIEEMQFSIHLAEIKVFFFICKGFLTIVLRASAVVFILYCLFAPLFNRYKLWHCMCVLCEDVCLEFNVFRFSLFYEQHKDRRQL